MIAYSNILRTATVDSEATTAGYPMANGLTGRTSEQVGFTNGADREVVFDCGATSVFSTLCVAHHNLGTVGATIEVEGSADDTTYTPITSKAFTDDFVTVHSFSESTYRYIKLIVTGHTAPAFVADVFIGPALELPSGPGVGWTQPSQGDDDEITANITGNGGIVGVSVIPRPKQSKIQFREFEKSWFDSSWSDLVASLKQYPAYYLWKESERPIYFVPSSSVKPPTFTSHNRQNATIDILGLV